MSQLPQLSSPAKHCRCDSLSRGKSIPRALRHLRQPGCSRGRVFPTIGSPTELTDYELNVRHLMEYDELWEEEFWDELFGELLDQPGQ